MYPLWYLEVITGLNWFLDVVGQGNKSVQDIVVDLTLPAIFMKAVYDHSKCHENPSKINIYELFQAIFVATLNYCTDISLIRSHLYNFH